MFSKSKNLETYDINKSEEEENNRKSDISNYSKISKKKIFQIEAI